MKTLTVKCLAPGVAQGPLTILSVPLSFWGGFDVNSGKVIDRSHPECGEVLTGRILAMPSGRGSSSGSSILAEAIRCGTAPAGMILSEADPILLVGAIVAQKLYGIFFPIVVCPASDLATLDPAGKSVRIEAQSNAVATVSQRG